MLRNACIIVLVYGLAFGLSQTASAAGIGVYGSAGGGRFLQIKTTELFQDIEGISNIHIFGCGFIADTNLGKEKIFNYRFKLGYDYQGSNDPKVNNLHRLTITNIFGAGIYTNRFIRIWLGPYMGLGYFWGRNSYYNLSYSPIVINSIPYYFKPNSITLRYSSLNINAGITLGINININDHVTIPVEACFRYNFFAHFKKMDDAASMEGFCTAGVMYRFNESVYTMNQPNQLNTTANGL